jgi:hypothetical protein
MSKVTITHNGTETTVYNPDFVDTLFNNKEVAVDGRIFANVTQVTFEE